MGEHTISLTKVQEDCLLSTPLTVEEFLEKAAIGESDQIGTRLTDALVANALANPLTKTISADRATLLAAHFADQDYMTRQQRVDKLAADKAAEEEAARVVESEPKEPPAE